MNEPLKIGDKYECAMCHYTFQVEKCHEYVLEESRLYFGEKPLNELEVVCDECWQKIHPERN